MMATLLLALTLSQGAHAGAASGREARQVQLDLASAMVEGGQPNAALGLIATLRQQGARGPELDLLQARAARQAGLLDAAEAQLNALIEAHPRRADALAERGLLRMAQLDPGRAATDLARATELDRNQPDYWNNLGFALLAAGDPEAAVSALRQAQDLDSESRTIRNNLGLAYIAQGKVTDASALLDVTYPPAEARYRLAVALELYGALHEARRSYAEALSLDPALSAAQRALDRLDNPPGSTEERRTP